MHSQEIAHWALEYMITMFSARPIDSHWSYSWNVLRNYTMHICDGCRRLAKMWSLLRAGLAYVYVHVHVCVCVRGWLLRCTGDFSLPLLLIPNHSHCKCPSTPFKHGNISRHLIQFMCEKFRHRPSIFDWLTSQFVSHIFRFKITNKSYFRMEFGNRTKWLLCTVISKIKKIYLKNWQTYFSVNAVRQTTDSTSIT